ncbi:MAG: patatin-like phospholipase family protein [Methyloligellaceae bacterium]
MSGSGPGDVKKINLALQGGGAHGAFTWGVLDCFLEQSNLEIEAISGTSAGAMNAVVVAEGLMRDGRDGAREGLRRFWQTIGNVAQFSPIQRGPIDRFLGNWGLDYSPVFVAFDLMNRLSSPYEFNPLNINPLKTVIEDNVDFDLVRACDQLMVFVSATNVETGRVKVFDRRELTADMVMASACLPFMFQAVEIDGVPYWDGGYMGNPVLYPFYYSSSCDDIVVVQINPVERKGAPKSAREILDRVNEITFNGSFLRELRAIDFVGRLLENDEINNGNYRNIRMHIVEAHEQLAALGASTKLNAEWEFLEHLHDIGRQAAEGWLTENRNHIGSKSTVDVRAMFQGIGGMEPH